MSRRTRRLLPISVSIQQCAEMLSISPRVIKEAIARKELALLESHIGSPRRRLLVSQIEEWMLKYWTNVVPK